MLRRALRTLTTMAGTLSGEGGKNTFEWTQVGVIRLQEAIQQYSPNFAEKLILVHRDKGQWEGNKYKAAEKTYEPWHGDPELRDCLLGRSRIHFDLNKEGRLRFYIDPYRSTNSTKSQEIASERLRDLYPPITENVDVPENQRTRWLNEIYGGYCRSYELGGLNGLGEGKTAFQWIDEFKRLEESLIRPTEENLAESARFIKEGLSEEQVKKLEEAIKKIGG